VSLPVGLAVSSVLVAEFLAGCEGAGLPSLAAVQPMHVMT
jgi:hypothetical protein